MKKKISILFILLALVLVGCSKESKLKEYNEEKIVKLTEESINLVNEGKYEDLINNYFSDYTKSLASAEELGNALKEYNSKVGEFEKFGKRDIIEKENQGEIYCIIAQESIHKDGKLTYTITYTKDYEILEFYIK